MLNIDKTMEEQNVEVEELTTEEENELEEAVGTEEEVNVEDDIDDETGGDSSQSAKDRAQSQIDRLKAKLADKEAELEALKSKTEKKTASKGKTSSETERFDKIELKLGGITEPSEQEFVLDLMKVKNLDVDQALRHPTVVAGLRAIREEAKAAQASAPTSNRTAKASADLTLKRAYQLYKKTGEVQEGLTAPQTLRLMNMIKQSE